MITCSIIATLAALCFDPVPTLAHHHRAAHHTSNMSHVAWAPPVPIPMPRPRPIAVPPIEVPPPVVVDSTPHEIVAALPPEEIAAPPHHQPKETSMLQSLLGQFSIADLVLYAVLAFLLYNYVTKHGWPWIAAKVKSIFGSASDDVKAIITAVPAMNDRLVALEKDVAGRLAALEQKVGLPSPPPKA